jgi:3-deoxy-D-manno-octulosonic-acid transferase
MKALYDLIFVIGAIFFLPRYLFKGKFHPGFKARFGFFPKKVTFNRPIWIHAVSVGEVMAIRGLLEELRKSYPHKQFVISTVTPTGNKIARNIALGHDCVTYLPLDLSFIVSGVIARVNPSLFILTETEFWPNLITRLYQKQIPIIAVNARISDASLRGYMSVKFILKHLLNKINLFCAQSKRDAERLARLGVAQDKIRVTGNMKFDIKDYGAYKKTCLPAGRDDMDLKLRLGIKGRLLVAGSTHPGEEELVLAAYKKLLADFSDLRLLIAPRHPERANEVRKAAKASGFPSRLISQDGPGLPEDIFILDSVGQLMPFYAIADIVFVGGSLVRKGGHNILEPAVLGKPVLFGRHMFNFRDIADMFLEHEAAVCVSDAEDLRTKIKALLRDASKLQSLSQRAHVLLAANKGATQKNLQLISQICADISTV